MDASGSEYVTNDDNRAPRDFHAPEKKAGKLQSHIACSIWGPLGILMFSEKFLLPRRAYNSGSWKFKEESVHGELDHSLPKSPAIRNTNLHAIP